MIEARSAMVGARDGSVVEYREETPPVRTLHRLRPSIAAVGRGVAGKRENGDVTLPGHVTAVKLLDVLESLERRLAAV